MTAAPSSGFTFGPVLSLPTFAEIPSNNAPIGTTDKHRRGSRNGLADVIPFPMTRRVHFITNAFTAVANQPDREVTRYFRSIVKGHRRRLVQLGVTPKRIGAELAELESMLFGTPQR